MSVDARASDFFVAGGTLRPDAPSYVKRSEDDELLDLALTGEFCYVLTPRQMGKSSLMVQAVRRLQERGVRTAIIDLTSIGTDVSVEQWYLGLITRLTSQLRLRVDPEAWWVAHASLGVVQRFTDFLHDVVLVEIEGPVVIFMDEIDTTLNLGFSDDFFAAIRSTYNARASDPAYNRLTFVLLGVAAPADLIKDPNRTPFNIGHRVDLHEFSQEDAGILQQGLEAVFPQQGQTIFARIYHWTNGHPYLTQKLCLAATEAGNGRWTDERVDGLVERLFLAKEARKEANLQFVRSKILDHPQARQLLALYHKVYRGREIRENERSPVQNQLKLSGLVRAEEGTLRVRNEIYRRVFDLGWIKDNTPTDWTRRIAGILALLVVFLGGAIGFSIYRQGQMAAEVRAQAFVDSFRSTTSAEVRVTSLAGLFGLPDYENQARQLFYEELSSADQLALFDLADPQTVETQLITTVKGLYSDQKDNESGNALLHAMIQPLRKLDDPLAVNLATEIEQWLQGRAYYAQGEYRQAVTAYSVAISLNDHNPGAYLDRSRACVGSEDYRAALDDLGKVIQLNPKWLPTVREVIEENPKLFEYLGTHRDVHPDLATYFPTLTPTPIPTPVLTTIPTPTPTSTQEPRVGDTWVRPADGMVMAFVPAGEFEMGSDDEDVDHALQLCSTYRSDCKRSWFERERPIHTVALSSFWIDRTEVTNAQYQQCVEMKGCELPTENTSHTRSTYYGNSSHNDYPVIYITWRQAASYCAWAGARLPTEAEWEYTARGPQRWTFPWGNEFDGTRLSYCDANCEFEWADKAFDDSYTDTAPVGSYPGGTSWCRVLNMAGNVYEWTKDWYGGYLSEQQTNPTGPSSGEYYVARGGSWRVGRDGTRCTGRVGLAPDESKDDLGFRCVVPVSPSTTPTPNIRPTPTEAPTPIPTVLQLTSGLGQDREPSFSPDGTRIAFISDQDGNQEIYVMSVDRSGSRRLTFTPDIQEDLPSFSPDGSKIIFGSINGHDEELYMMNTDGSQIQNICNAPNSNEGRPRFSSSSLLITFDSDRNGNWEIYTARLQVDELADVKQVTNRPDFVDRLPSFSPSGDLILFRAQAAGRGAESSRIHLARIDGSVARLSAEYADWYPAMSPNGKWIAFVSDRDGNSEIYVMDLNGSNVTRLTNNPASDQDPAFSPDGRWLVFASDRVGNNFDIFRLLFGPPEP